MRVENLTKKTLLSENAKLAKGFWQKMLGLMGKKIFCPFDSLILYHCRSIHTFFMNFPIDVIFVDKDFRVVSIFEQLKPYRLTAVKFKACSVLELPEGTIKRSKTEIGDRLRVQG